MALGVIRKENVPVQKLTTVHLTRGVFVVQMDIPTRTSVIWMSLPVKSKCWLKLLSLELVVMSQNREKIEGSLDSDLCVPMHVALCRF